MNSDFGPVKIYQMNQQDLIYSIDILLYVKLR